MNRRGFLQLLSATAAMAATGLSLEELLAPEKTIFLPAAPVIASPVAELNTGLSLFIPQLWSDDLAAQYRGNLIFTTHLTSRINREYARLANTGSYNIFEDRVRLYQGSL